MVVELRYELLVGREIIKESLPNYTEVANRFETLIGKQTATPDNDLRNYFTHGNIQRTLPLAMNLTGEPYAKQMMVDLILIVQAETDFVTKSHLVMGWLDNIRIRRLDV